MSFRAILCAVVFSVILLGSPSLAATTSFSYQGELVQNGSPANGNYNLRFTLHNVVGTQVGPTIQLNNTPVVNGKFTVQLDFGFDAFDIGDRFLEVRVNSTTLSPRQPITAAPFAIKTRGLYVNENESFIGVGRSYKITPSEKFGIHMNTNEFGGMYVETGSSGEPFYGYSRNGTVDAYHYFDSTSNQWRLWSGADRIVVDRADGDVGIGTTNPSFPLHVVGNDPSAVIWATNTNPNGNAITGQNDLASSADPAVSGVSGGTSGAGLYGYCWSLTGVNYGVYGASNSPTGYDFYAGGPGINYGDPSSIRWKNNIEAVEDPLGMLAQIRGVYFDWDEEHGGQRGIGFIGEEVGKVLPEIVGFEEDGEFVTGMDYSKMTPLLVEAVNALRAEKDAEIAALHERIEALETLIDQHVLRVQKGMTP